MASIIDSIRSVHSDRFALIKIGLFSYIIHLIYKLIMPNEGANLYNVFVGGIIVLLYIGFSSIIISNRINQRIETLPVLNINKYLEVAFKGFGLLIPFAVINIIIIGFVVGLFNFEGIPQLIAIWLIRFSLFSAFATALINFSEKYELKDGFDINKLLSGMADVLVYTFIAIIIIGIFIAAIAAPVLYMVYTFFKIGILFEYLIGVFATISLSVLSDYWGQLHYDISSRDKYY